jgi:AraC-like DNA-binding protein
VDRAAQALAAAHGGVDAWTLAARAGLGDRQFRRRFVEHAGMGPKHYAKVARFAFALALKTARPSRTWADVSQRAGYFDQMHLVKDFNRSPARRRRGSSVRSARPDATSSAPVRTTPSTWSLVFRISDGRRVRFLLAALRRACHRPAAARRPRCRCLSAWAPGPDFSGE